MTSLFSAQPKLSMGIDQARTVKYHAAIQVHPSGQFDLMCWRVWYVSVSVCVLV